MARAMICLQHTFVHCAEAAPAMPAARCLWRTPLAIYAAPACSRAAAAMPRRRRLRLLIVWLCTAPNQPQHRGAPAAALHLSLSICSIIEVFVTRYDGAACSAQRAAFVTQKSVYGSVMFYFAPFDEEEYAVESVILQICRVIIRQPCRLSTENAPRRACDICSSSRQPPRFRHTDDADAHARRCRVAALFLLTRLSRQR